MTTSGTVTQRSVRMGAMRLLLAAVLWNLNGIFVRSLRQSDLGGWGIAGFRSLFACLFLTPLAWRRWKPISDRAWVLAAVLAFRAMCATSILFGTVSLPLREVRLGRAACTSSRHTLFAL